MTEAPASRFPISVSMAARCRSSCASRCLCCCFSNRCRTCFWRFSAAVRSLTSASRATCRSSRARCTDDEASVGRRSTAAQVHRGAHLRQHPRVHRVGLGPLADGLRKAPRVQRVDTHQRQPGLEQRFLEGAVPPAGRLVGDGANRHLDPRDQRLESRRVIGEPRGLAGGNHVHVEMRLRDVNTDGRIGHLSCSCACHSSLHAHVSIQDVGKDGGDHTALRPLDGPRRTRADHRLPRRRFARGAAGLGHLKAHSSPIVNRQAKAAVRGPRVRADRSPADRAAVPPASAPLRRNRAVAHDVEAQFSTVVTPALGAGHPVDRVHRSRVPGGTPRFSPEISEVKATDQQRPAQAPSRH